MARAVGHGRWEASPPAALAESARAPRARARVVGQHPHRVAVRGGQETEHALRQTRIALRLADCAGLDRAERAVVYYVGLLAWVGCHVDAYEQAKWFGDDQAFKADQRRTDIGRPLPAARFVLRHLGAGRPAIERARLGLAFAGDGRRAATVVAVFASAGHRVPRRRDGPAGLTARELEVLRLLTGGLTNREIAERLVISSKTVSRHVEHIYAKTGATPRTAR